MKTNNSFPTRIVAFVLSLIMLLSVSVPVMAADVEVTATKYYTVDYNSETGFPQIILTLNADELGRLLEDRNFTKEELKKFLPDIFAKALENGTLPSLQELIDFFPKELLVYEELTKVIPEDIFTTLLTPDVLSSLLKDEALEALLTDEIIEALLTKDVLNKLLQDDVVDKLLEDKETVKDLLDDKEIVKKLLEDKNIVKKLLNDENTVKKLLEDKETVKKLLNDDIIKSFVSTPSDAKAFIDGGVISKTDVENLLTFDEKASLVGSADPEADALKLAINNHSGELAGLLKADLDAVIDVVGIDKIINIASLDDIINQVGLDAIIDTVGLDAIIATVELDAIINAVGLDAIIKVVGLDKIIATVGMDNIISTVGVDKIIATIGIDKIIQVVDKGQLLTLAKNMISQIVLNKLNSLDITTNSNNTILTANVLEFSNTDLCFDLKLNDIVNIIAKSIPTVESLRSIKDGDIIYDLSVKMGFEGTASTGGLGITVKVAGDTAVLNENAAKVFELIDYQINDGLDIELKVEDDSADAPFKFAEIFAKVLETDRLTATEKAKLFSIFEKTGFELVTALKELDVDKFAEFVDANYIPYIKTLRDKSVQLLEAVMNNAPGKYDDLSLNLIYKGNGTFAFDADASIPTDKVINKLISFLGISESDFASVFKYDSEINGSIKLDAHFKDLYRVSYCTEAGEPLYSTYLPVGADISLISDNTAILAGLAPNGWANKNGKVVTTMPAEDLLLFTDYPDTFTATFMANGKVIRVIPFVAGDTTLAEIPQVPPKKGYKGEWEKFTLGSENIIINAEYTPNTYKVIFDANGGEGTMDAITAIYDESFNVPANAFVREGYVFNGWATKANGNGISCADQGTLINLVAEGEVTLYAQWIALPLEVFKATFMADGSMVDVVSFTEGDSILFRVPKVPARVGYTGVWEDYTLEDSNITINAVYTPNNYNVSFHGNGGTGSMDSILGATYDVLFTLPENVFVREGYEFIGWNTKANGNGIYCADKEAVKNLTTYTEAVLYAQWNPIVPSYEATFIAEGVVIDSVTFIKTETVLSRVPEVPAKEGYKGVWEVYDLGEEDIVIRAIYTPNIYKVVFDANGGIGTLVSVNATFDKQFELSENTFARYGYRFLGWNTEADGTGTYYADKAIVNNLVAEGVATLYAQWEALEAHNATFMVGDTVVEVVIFYEGEAVLSNIPEVPAKLGYVGEWGVYELGNTDIIINAEYTANSYNVVLNANGGAGTMNNIAATYDVEFKLPANALTRLGYAFKGWNTKADGTGVAYSDEAEVKNLVAEGDITLYAQWEALRSYTATFVADGKIVDVVIFYEGDTALYRVPEVPAKNGYTGAWESYTVNSSNITVKAEYTVNNYKVKFDANGGTGNMYSVNATYNVEFVLAANAFVRDGYKFIGWNTEKDGSGIAYADKAKVSNLACEGEITLYAQWKSVAELESYTATFWANNVIVGTVTFFEGDTALKNVPAVPAKVGHTGAWEKYVLANTNIAINAEYTPNSYKIVFDANGGEGTMAELAATYNKAMTLPMSVFARNGYTFNGWNTKADGSGTAYADKASVANLAAEGEVTLYAQWEIAAPKTYIATFVVDGKYFGKVTFVEGATALEGVPAVPAKVGYTGTWEAYTLGAKNITINAKYVVNNYKVIFNANDGEGTMADVTATYGAELVLAGNTFVREGFSFKGWNTKADGTGIDYADKEAVKNLATEGEVTLYAQWEELPADDNTVLIVIIVVVVVVVLAAAGVVIFIVLKKKKNKNKAK